MMTRILGAGLFALTLVVNTFGWSAPAHSRRGTNVNVNRVTGAQRPWLRIGGFDFHRSQHGSFTEGDFFDQARASILAHFPGATFASTSTLTPEFLSRVDVFVLTVVPNKFSTAPALSSREQAALRNFVAQGGCLIALLDHSVCSLSIAQSLADAYGSGAAVFIFDVSTFADDGEMTGADFSANEALFLSTVEACADRKSTRRMCIGFDEFPDGVLVAPDTIITTHYQRLGVIFSSDDPLAPGLITTDRFAASLPNSARANPHFETRVTFVLPENPEIPARTDVVTVTLANAIEEPPLTLIALDTEGNEVTRAEVTFPRSNSIFTLQTGEPVIHQVRLLGGGVIDDFCFAPVVEARDQTSSEKDEGERGHAGDGKTGALRPPAAVIELRPSQAGRAVIEDARAIGMNESAFAQASVVSALFQPATSPGFIQANLVTAHFQTAPTRSLMQAQPVSAWFQAAPSASLVQAAPVSVFFRAFPTGAFAQAAPVAALFPSLPAQSFACALPVSALFPALPHQGFVQAAPVSARFQLLPMQPSTRVSLWFTKDETKRR